MAYAAVAERACLRSGLPFSSCPVRGPPADGVFEPVGRVGAPQSQPSRSSRQRTPGRLAPKPPPARVCHLPAKARSRLACPVGLSRSTDAAEVPTQSTHFWCLALGEGSRLRGHKSSIAQAVQETALQAVTASPAYLSHADARSTSQTSTSRDPPGHSPASSGPKRKAGCRIRRVPGSQTPNLRGYPFIRPAMNYCEALELKPRASRIQHQAAFAASNCRAPLHYRHTSFVTIGTNMSIPPSGRSTLPRGVRMICAAHPACWHTEATGNLFIFF